MILLVKEKKGYTVRLIDIENGIELRSDNKNLTIGSLLTAKNVEITGNFITSMNIISEIIGDSSKGRVEVDISKVKLGDLIDGVPVLGLGKTYAKSGKKMAYAYFK